jgi:2,3-bisphosphoglycerate-independent phosphoglycerate mutase
MKYIVLLGDGMADYPIPELGGKTPLEVANKPNMDFLAKHGLMGTVKTVPDGFPPGSDVANLSVFGYDPKKYYTGRSPLEAVSMGVQMKDTDIAIRCNLVTLSEEENYEDKSMLDYSSGEISTKESCELMQTIAESLNSEAFSFYSGISYRHCLVWNKGKSSVNFTPPHDISGRKISSFLPSGDDGDVFLSLMKRSEDILKNHPVNLNRISNGLNPATSIWLWGEGTKPFLTPFAEKYEINGSVISAVDLVHGIGILAGLKTVHVQGATGNIHTNFKGKAEAALNELENGSDFVYLHIEAPDECGHQGLMDKKIQSIEKIDSQVLALLLKGLEKWDYSLLLLPDHPTPLSIKTHSRDPVPFVIYRNFSKHTNPGLYYFEKDASSTGLHIDRGHTLMDMFLKS